MPKNADVDAKKGATGVPGEFSKFKLEQERSQKMEALESMARYEATFRDHLTAQVSSAKRLMAAQQELARGCEHSRETFSNTQHVAAWALREIHRLRMENEVMRKRIEANPLDDGLVLEVMEQHKYSSEEEGMAMQKSWESKEPKSTAAKSWKKGSGESRENLIDPKLVQSLQTTSDVESASASAPGTGNSPQNSDGETPRIVLGSSTTNSTVSAVARPEAAHGCHGKYGRGIPVLGNWVEEGAGATPLPPPGSPQTMDMVQAADATVTGFTGGPDSQRHSAEMPPLPEMPLQQTMSLDAATASIETSSLHGTNGTDSARMSLESKKSFAILAKADDEKQAEPEDTARRGTLVACLAVPAAPGSQLMLPTGGTRGANIDVTEDDEDDTTGCRVSQVPDLPNTSIGSIGYNKVCTKMSINSTVSDMRNSCDQRLFDVLEIWKKSKATRASKSLRQSLGANAKGRQSGRTTERFSAGATKELGRGTSLISSNSVGALSEVDLDEDGEGIRHMVHSCCKKIIVHPNNHIRTFWDILSLFLVGYDTITIPLAMFDPPKNGFIFAMSWTTRIFWSFDMPLQFVTGFIRSNGYVEMRFFIIARRYILTWWFLDVGLLAIDWFEVFMSVSSTVGFARIGKASRTFRVVRMVRLMRLLRITQVLKGLTERIISDIFLIFIDILKSMAVIMALAHLCACVWYGIGAAGTSTNSWVRSMPNGFAQSELGYRYAASLHWSLSQFSGGMDEIAPKSYSERLFAIAIYLLAFVVAGIFVSGLTSSMTRLVIIGSHQSQQLGVLRRYLLQQGISNTLCLRIQRNAAYALSERTKYVPEDKIDLLHFVSEPLRVELHFEIYSPVLRVHPFFLRYMEDCPQVMRKVCHSAIQTMQVSHNDVLFHLGEKPSHPKVYFIKTGLLLYVCLSGTEREVTPKMWACEAALWTNWIHRGQLTAITDCRLYALDCKKFQDIASSFEHHDFDPKKYAAEFVRDLNQCSSNEVTDLPFEEELRCQQEARDRDHHHDHSHSVVMHETVEQLQITRKSNMPSEGEAPEPSPSRRMSYLQQTALNYQQKRGSISNLNSPLVSGRKSLRNSISAMGGMATGLMSGNGKRGSMAAKRGGSLLVTTGVSPTDSQTSGGFKK